MTQDANSHGDAQSKRCAPTLWAQRNSVVFLTFKVESCKNPEVLFEANKVTFTGKDSHSTVEFENEIQLYDDIKPEGCVWSKKGPGIECTLQKQANGFWPRLLKEKIKVHWLKVDFNKWIDEDEMEDSKDEADEMDLSQMMAQMGGGGGMPGMDGLDDDDEEEDSDDEDLPELEEAPDNNGDIA